MAERTLGDVIASDDYPMLTDRLNHVAGRWYAPCFAVMGSGFAGQHNKINLLPFLLAKAATISDLGARVNLGQAGASLQLAIYASDAATHLPTGNPLAVTPSISIASAGAVSGDINGANVTLSPGLYWSASNIDNSTPTLMSCVQSFNYHAVLIGSTTLANMLGSTASGGCVLQVAQSFGTWPDLTGASFTEAPTTAHNAAALFFKAA
jgi:hypothetical protein